MRLLVVSKSNVASSNIGSFLKQVQNAKLELTKKGVLELDYLEGYRPKPSLILVASSHKSAKEIRSLTAHPTGNWASADLGGRPRTLSIAPALYIAEAVRQLQDRNEQTGSQYKVSLEVTHHSPTIDVPVMFAEVGGSEKEWSDMQACEAVAHVLQKLVASEPQRLDVAVGFGGPHYAPHFTRKVLEGKFAVGHICPGYHADVLDEEMVLQAINKTIPKPDFAALEWKGLKPAQRQKITEILDKNKFNWERL